MNVKNLVKCLKRYSGDRKVAARIEGNDSGCIVRGTRCPDGLTVELVLEEDKDGEDYLFGYKF